MTRIRLYRSLKQRVDERGVVAVFLALSMTMMLGVTALVIDLGNARQQRRVAQAAADAAALAVTDYIAGLNGNFTGSTAQWSAAMTLVKNYAQANFNIDPLKWTGCHDANALAYHPDSANGGDTCLSSDYQSWPAWVTGETTKPMHIRVRLPTTGIKTFFAGILGSNTLYTQAVSTAVVTRTTQTITNLVTTTTHVAGGPCAICLLGSGLTLDGQNGDVTITGGNVVVNSTSSTAGSLNPNGHVKITTSGGTIGGPGSCGPSWCDNFTGSGYSPSPTQEDPVTDPLANVPQCGNGSPGTTNYCPTNTGSNGTQNKATLSPGIYSTISGSHTLNPGVYIIKSGITLNGNDLITGTGVMLYFACSNYPTPCSSGQTGAAITATGNGALHLSPPTAAQCTASSSLCPYVGMMYFADRNNAATSTFRGNGTN